MKKISYLFVAILAFVLLTNVAYACSTSDQCSNCGNQNAHTSCCSALEREKNSNCANSCRAGVPSTVCEQCKNSSTYKCKPFTPSTPTPNNPNDGGGGSGGGGGNNPTIPDDPTELCTLCQSFNTDSNSTATTELKEKCQEAGCPIQENNSPGVITAPGITYKDNTDDNTLTGCEKIFGNYSNGKFTNTNSLGYFLSLSFKIIKYIVPIILIVLTSVDFLKGIASSDKDIIKAATSKLTRRAIIALAIFLVPTILNFVLGIVTSYGTCGVK